MEDVIYTTKIVSKPFTVRGARTSVSVLYTTPDKQLTAGNVKMEMHIQKVLNRAFWKKAPLYVWIFEAFPLQPINITVSSFSYNYIKRFVPFIITNYIKSKVHHHMIGSNNLFKLLSDCEKILLRIDPEKLFNYLSEEGKLNLPISNVSNVTLYLKGKYYPTLDKKQVWVLYISIRRETEKIRVPDFLLQPYNTSLLAYLIDATTQ